MVININKSDLQITQEAFFRIFDAYKASGMTVNKAYYAADELCKQNGYQTCFNSFEYFREKYYKKYVFHTK